MRGSRAAECSSRSYAGPSHSRLYSHGPLDDPRVGPAGPVVDKNKRGKVGFSGAAHRALLRSFVGRAAALKVLEGALSEATSEGEPRLVTCLGPAGMGKTTLLQVFAEEARSSGSRVVWLDAGAITRDDATLERALGAPMQTLGGAARADLIVVDGLERDPALLGWLFDDVLPRAGARITVVTTSREPTALAHRASSLSAITRELRLRPLSDEETIDALARRGVPPAQRAELATLAAGLPRAVAELAQRSRVDRPTPLADRPPHELVDAVAAGIVRDLPSVLHRHAVEAMAVACALDEPLLAAMLADVESSGTDVHALYTWLGALTFVVRDVRGLIPHPRVRDALLRELEVRDPVRLRELGQSAALELLRRVDGAGLPTRHHHVLEALFAQRTELGLAASLLEGAGQERLRRASGADLELGARLVASVDPASSHLFDAVAAQHPERVVVLARPDAAPSMIAVLVPLDDESAPEAVRQLAGGAAPRVLALTFSSLTQQARIAAHLAAHVALSMLAIETLDAASLSMSLPAELIPHAPLLGATRAVGSERFVTDLSALSGGATGPLGVERVAYAIGMPLRSDAVLAEAPASHPSAARALPPLALPPLDEATLAAWVRSALSARHRPHELKKSEMLSLACIERSVRGGAAPEQALAQLLDESCRALASAPAYESSARLLEVTYLDPSIVKQEAAAAELRLPFGTYRYQLRRALELVTVEIATREDEARRASR